ncbi:abortive infection system antitoxin AbiGi family protein [Lysobacter sp. F60174L2]|uniref:abortive infection system antitoxin AbiGi family protein n=1 Tax=Lysobacter sp. F60174L2 TaxID=3459295 RepID=UPI00403DA9C5
MQNFVSNTLYHLVGRGRPEADHDNFETLCAILRSMELRTCEVAGARGGARISRDPDRPIIDGEPAEQSVVCFCDIPRDQLWFHARRYGKFGLGLRRSVVAQWGARPVIYIPVSDRAHGNWGKRFGNNVKTVLSGLDSFFPSSLSPKTRVVGSPAVDAQDAADEAAHLIARDLQAFLKFWNVDLPDGHPENFYMEREWRKFGNLQLALCLEEIVAPPKYHDELVEIIKGVRDGGRYSLGQVRIASIKRQAQHTAAVQP